MPGSALDVLILLDASGSMNLNPSGATCDGGGCGADSKWAQTTAAINTIVAQTGTIVNWGIKLFPDGGACTVSASPDVPVGPDNQLAIANAMAIRTGKGNTPTRVAVQAAAAYLGTLNDDNRKLILLATDGGQNCMPGNSDASVDDSAGAVDAIASAAQQGVPTLVVGIGPPCDTVMNDPAAHTIAVDFFCSGA